jgi:hypothetical protein
MVVGVGSVPAPPAWHTALAHNSTILIRFLVLKHVKTALAEQTASAAFILNLTGQAGFCPGIGELKRSVVK